MKKILGALICLGLIFFFQAESRAEMELSVGAGGSVGNSPYKGYGTQWSAFPLISFESDYFYIRGLSGGFKFVNIDFLELSVFGAYDPTSFKHGDSSNSALRKLKNRHESALAGMQAMLLTPVGMFLARAAGDVLGHSEGFTGEIGYRYSLELGPVEFVPALGAYWHSSKYNNYYYGVSEGESLDSGLKAYDAGSGFTPYLGLTVDWSVTDNWEIFVAGEIDFLSSSIKDSPMVGRSSTQSLSGGFTYTF